MNCHQIYARRVGGRERERRLEREKGEKKREEVGKKEGERDVQKEREKTEREKWGRKRENILFKNKNMQNSNFNFSERCICA